jgi:hypothetical protein
MSFTSTLNYGLEEMRSEGVGAYLMITEEMQSEGVGAYLMITAVLQ